MRIASIMAGLMLALAASAARGGDVLLPDTVEADAATPAAPSKTVCQLIEEAAAAHAIPVGFFTRLIWRESSFRAGAVSPKGAQGIAQFMPGTAALRRLADPFDPAAAIPASAHYLRDLSDRFGNLGLAAAAYNAGEKRVSNWLGGSGGLPFETRAYVVAITGAEADDWAAPVQIAAGLEAAATAAADAGAATEPAPPAADPAAAKAATIGAVVPPAPTLPVDGSCEAVAALLARPGAGSKVVESVAQAPWAPWGAQVAGNFSLNRAIASYAALQRRHPGILAGQLPLVVRTVNRSRGRAPLFQIRVPADSREAASALCRKLQSAGGACVVFRN